MFSFLKKPLQTNLHNKHNNPNVKWCKNAEIHFHSQDNSPIDLFIIPNEHHFGILELEVKETKPTTLTQEILCSEDTSGSMTGECKDGRSKMEHAKNTTKKIIDVLSNLEEQETNTNTPSKNPNIWISINGFNSKVSEILPWTKIEKSEMENIRDKIENLIPQDSTNIELALKEGEKSLHEIQRQPQPQSQKTHIFLTDGNATDGVSNPHILSKMINEIQDQNKDQTQKQKQKTQNIFVGFGSDHNGYLLQKLASSITDGMYYFIDNVQHTGLVFGEIVYEIIYKAVENVEIEIENGEIYDYKTNCWSNSIKIRSLVGEAKKTYHIRTTRPKQVKVNIKGNTESENKEKTNEILTVVSEGQKKDLTKFILRQRTQELLYEVTDILSKECDLEYQVSDTDTKALFLKNPQDQDQEDRYSEVDLETELSSSSKNEIKLTKKKELKEKKNELRNTLKNFMDKLSKHIQENNLEKDEFYTGIYEDIKTTYKTIDKRNAIMYSCARQNSQGRQTSYSPKYEDDENTEVDDDIFCLTPSPVLRRKNRRKKEMKEDIFRYLTLENTTPMKMKIMREVSSYVSSPSSKSRSSSNSPPLIDENICVEKLQPLTEMDEIIFGYNTNTCRKKPNQVLGWVSGTGEGEELVELGSV